METFLWALLGKVVVLPIYIAVVTPLILISAPFRSGGIKDGYATAFRWWDEWF